MNLLDGLFRSEEVEKWLSERTCLQAMLSFESALAKAESHAGVIPKSVVQPISQQCKAPLFDLAALSKAAKSSGNIAIPIIKALTALVAKNNAEASGYVHLGATSQDVIDTGLILQLCGALTCIAADVETLAKGLAELATEHRSTVMVGRTWMQHASPTTFGAKVAGWLDAIDRHRDRLRETQARCLVLQFGGAVGTHAALDGKGDEVAKYLAHELKLPLAEIPWHSHRDRVAEIATTLGLLVGTLGKIATDISLLSQTEVAEVFEPAEKGRGGSSTMPLASEIQLRVQPCSQRRRECPDWWARCSLRCPKNTNADSAAGTRSGRRCPKLFRLPAARRTRWRRSFRDWTLMRNG